MKATPSFRVRTLAGLRPWAGREHRRRVAPETDSVKGEEQSEPPGTTRRLLRLALAAIGVVYGDIGTSPLYALRECFHGQHRVAAYHRSHVDRSEESPATVRGSG